MFLKKTHQYTILLQGIRRTLRAPSHDVNEGDSTIIEGMVCTYTQIGHFSGSEKGQQVLGYSPL